MQNGTGPDVRLSPHTSLESTPFPSTPPGLSHSGVVGSAGSATPAQAVMDPNRAFQAINAETLEQASQDVDYPLPPQNVRFLPFAQSGWYATVLLHPYDARVQVQDKVGFIVNNLSSANLDAKAKELTAAVTPDMWPWFANYMVVKRAAQEPNFHGIYLQVLLALPPCILCMICSDS